MNHWVVVSKQPNGTVTIYGPFTDADEVTTWRNSVADPQTARHTINSVHYVHSPDRIVSR